MADRGKGEEGTGVDFVRSPQPSQLLGRVAITVELSLGWTEAAVSIRLMA